MTDHHPAMKVNEIGSDQLYGAFLAGAQRIIVNQKLPLQDAAKPVGDVKLTALALADAAMTGARGNSELILVQFLYGFGNELPSTGTLHTAAFAQSMNRAGHPSGHPA